MEEKNSWYKKYLIFLYKQYSKIYIYFFIKNIPRYIYIKFKSKIYIRDIKNKENKEKENKIKSCKNLKENE